MSDPVNESGLFVSLRRLLATALEMAQVRLSLLGTEIELEKQRLFNGLLWGSIALMMLGMGLVLLCGFVILLFWEGYRLAATGGMALLFLSGGATLLYKARQYLQQRAGIFNASMSELDRDLSGLKAPEQHEQQ